MEILTTKPKIDQIIYKFSNLDFRDKITGIPLQYDIYVQKIQIKKIHRKYFFHHNKEDDDATEYYIISSIEINNILGNNPDKAGVTFYFKVNGTTKTIYVTYAIFNDVLEALGS